MEVKCRTTCKQSLLRLFFLQLLHLPLLATEGVLLLSDAVAQLFVVGVRGLGPSRAVLVVLVAVALIRTVVTKPTCHNRTPGLLSVGQSKDILSQSGFTFENPSSTAPKRQ